MADGVRREFVLSGIFHFVLFISCIYSAQSSSDDSWYRVAGREFSTNNVQVRSLHHRHVRQAGPDPTANSGVSSTGPDSPTNGNGGQTLPDTSNQPQSPGTSATNTPSPIKVTTSQPSDDSNNNNNNTGSISPGAESTNDDANNTANATNPATSDSTTTTLTTTTTVTTPKVTTANPFANAQIVLDDHDYYNTKALKDKSDKYYINISAAEKHETLSENHRVAAVIPLKFKFPFYGHLVNNVTVATGGFIYMSPFLHQWLTATQYIAPLMANFDPSLSASSNIFYLSQEEVFTVEWRDVVLQDQADSGGFTFQASLHSNGTIKFIYKDIPIGADKISDENHPVKIGLSDAYYNDTIIRHIGLRRRTIYEYHQVILQKSLVRSGAVIFVNPLPTCNILEDCESCTNHVDVNFDCMWCNTIGRCSDGLDWYRQHWDKYHCNGLAYDDIARCEGFDTTLPTVAMNNVTSINVVVQSASSTTTMTTQRSTAGSRTTTPPPPTTTTTTTTTITSTTAAPTSTTTVNSITTPTIKPTTKKLKETTTTIRKQSTSTMTTSTTTRMTPIMVTTSTSTLTKSPTTNPIQSTTTKPMTTQGKEEDEEEEEEEEEGYIYELDNGNAQTLNRVQESGICHSTNQTKECAGLPPPTMPIVHPITPLDHVDKKCKGGKCGKGKDMPVAVIVVVLLLVLGLIGGVAGWAYYAYTHPTSKSGMWLIQHRPSQIKAKIQFWKSSSSSSDSGAKYRAETDA